VDVRAAEQVNRRADRSHHEQRGGGEQQAAR
jgi:hypothetical protein